MDTKKLKPFDLEAAKAGAPVVTRDGRSARIICTDLKNGIYSVIALIPNEYEGEDFETYTINGKYHCGGFEDCRDLFMAPTKRQGWVNIYKDSVGDTRGCFVYGTQQQAREHARIALGYIATIPVEWEE